MNNDAPSPISSAPMPEQTPIPTPTPTANPPEKKKSNVAALVIVGILVVILGVCGVVAFNFINKVSEEAEQKKAKSDAAESSKITISYDDESFDIERDYGKTLKNVLSTGVELVAFKEGVYYSFDDKDKIKVTSDNIDEILERPFDNSHTSLALDITKGMFDTKFGNISASFSGEEKRDDLIKNYSNKTQLKLKDIVFSNLNLKSIKEESIKIDGKEVTFTKSSKADFDKIFGEPACTDDFADLKVRAYNYNYYQIGVNFDSDGDLKEILIYGYHTFCSE